MLAEGDEAAPSHYDLNRELVKADEEIKGANFYDEYAPFTFPKAMNLNYDREKLYLKALTQIESILDKNSPYYEITRKAVDSIASTYISEHKSNKILKTKFREFEQQQIQFESDLAEYCKEITNLRQARDHDRYVMNDTRGALDRLREENEDL